MKNRAYSKHPLLETKGDICVSEAMRRCVEWLACPIAEYEQLYPHQTSLKTYSQLRVLPPLQSHRVRGRRHVGHRRAGRPDLLPRAQLLPLPHRDQDV